MSVDIKKNEDNQITTVNEKTADRLLKCEWKVFF